MAQLKDTMVQGDLRVTGTVYGNASTATKATQDSDGNAINSTYLKRSGGTMTGKITALGSQYTDSYTSGAIDMQKSNIVGLNSLYTSDTSDNASEGIHFYRDSTHTDTMWMSGGHMYFVPNRTLAGSAASTSAADSKKVAILPASITSGHVVVTDGTSGDVKGVAASTLKVAEATKASQDADGYNIKANYMRTTSGNKSLSHGGTTTIGTTNGANVNLVMPAANADVFEVNASSTSFSDTLSAYNDGKKKLLLLAGREGTGSYLTQYRLPLYRVVFNGSTITQFVWIASDDAYNAASGSNSFGAIMYYKLSSSGWEIGTGNIDFATVAGSTLGDVVSATASSALTWGASVQNLLLTKSSGEVTVDVKNLIVGHVYWIHAGRALKVKFKNSGGSCTMYAYGTSATIDNTKTFDIQDNINYSVHGSFSAAVIRSSELNYYVMMGYGDAH